MITSGVSIISFGILQGDEEESDQVIVKKFHSDILKEEREIIIRLPRLYDSTKHYPIFYVLDGSSLDRIVFDKLEILTAAGYGQESIVIGIPNMTAESRVNYLIPPMMHTNSDDATSPMGKGDLFLDFIAEEVVPMVEDKYPSTSRIFCGNSRGGLLVAYSLSQKTDFFDARFCFSTPFWRERDVLIKHVETFLAQRDSLKTFFYLSAGNNETGNIKGGTERMNQVLKSHSNISVQYEINPKSIHQNNANNSMPSALVKWTEFVRRLD